MKLIHGDCLEETKDIPDNSIIVTDPPFNINYHYNSYKDDLDDGIYYEMLKKAARYRAFPML
ncbi:MAG: hypothetical protein KAR06_05855 [Deltaproteobacteria bacterium]|nr:hypothetical protein [Deltaproteobacteria bacterium]